MLDASLVTGNASDSEVHLDLRPERLSTHLHFSPASCRHQTNHHLPNYARRDANTFQPSSESSLFYSPLSSPSRTLPIGTAATTRLSYYAASRYAVPFPFYSY